MQAVAIWRDFNTLFSGLALFLSARRYIQFRRSWTFQEREVLRALIILLLGTFLGSIYGVFQAFPFGLGMPFATWGSVHAAQGALRKPARYRDPEDYNGADLARNPADPERRYHP